MSKMKNGIIHEPGKFCGNCARFEKDGTRGGYCDNRMVVRRDYGGCERWIAAGGRTCNRCRHWNRTDGVGMTLGICKATGELHTMTYTCSGWDEKCCRNCREWKGTREPREVLAGCRIHPDTLTTSGDRCTLFQNLEDDGSSSAKASASAVAAADKTADKTEDKQEDKQEKEGKR